jgi:hypothetical protein
MLLRTNVAWGRFLGGWTLTVGLLIALACPVSATIVRYDTRAEWEASVPHFLTDGFESYGALSTSSGRLVFDAFDFVVPYSHEPIGTCWAYPDDPLSCNNTTPPSPPNVVLRGDVHVDEDGSYNELEFHSPISWFAVDFLEVEDETYVDVSILGEVFAAYAGTFLGVVSSELFTTIRITGDRLAYAADNVSHPVPEPSTHLLLAFGLVGLAVGGRRRAR